MFNDELTTFKKGDILYAAKNRNKKGAGRPHYILCLSESGDLKSNFEGGMLTHTTAYESVAMNEAMFEKSDDQGNGWHVQYDDSQLRLKKFIKLSKWAPFYKVGQLTADGIAFLEENIGELDAEEYAGNK